MVDAINFVYDKASHLKNGRDLETEPGLDLGSLFYPS